MPSNDPETASDVAEAVLAVPDVVAMSESSTGEPTSDPSAEFDPTTTWLHVTVGDAHAPAATAENVQQAAHLITGGPVNVTVEEIVESSALPPEQR